MQESQVRPSRGAFPWQPAQALAPRRIPDAVLREAVAPGVFVGLILASNYALAALPNVKLFDLLVFAAGYTLGLRRGVMVAVAAWLVYGQINPWGAAHAQLLVTLMASETLYAAAGALVRRLAAPERITLRPGVVSLAFLLPALLATPLYDLATNAYTGYHWATMAGGGEYARWMGVALFNPGALFFMAVHVGANAILFPVFGPPLVRGAERVKGRLAWR